VAVSATTGDGVPSLLAELGSQLRPAREFLELRVPHEQEHHAAVGVGFRLGHLRHAAVPGGLALVSAGDEECLILSRDGSHRLLFVEVPEPKQAKNRIHFDLRPVAGSRDAELARLVEHGATTVDDRRNPDGTGWVVLADPEGNEFDILRSNAEVAATGGSVVG